MQIDSKQNNLSNFYLIIWWILAVGLIFGSRFWAFNQIILKAIIPLLFVLTIIKSGFFSRFSNKGFAFYFILTCWACLSLLYSVNTTLTLDYLQAMVGNVIIWFIVASAVAHARDIYSFLIPLIIVFTLHAYFGMTIQPEVVSERVIGRAQGLTSNANGLGFLMWYGIVVGCLMYMLSPKLLYKIAIVAVLAFMLTILFKTGSRKSLAALLIFAAVSGFLFMKKKNMMLMIFLLLGGALIFNFAYDYIIENTTVGARLGKETLEGGAAVRLQLVEEGLRFFFNNPVVGVGLGSFSSYSSTGMVAHNDYIEMLASMGLPAFIIYMTIFFDYYKKSLFLFKTGILPNFFIIAAGFGMGHVFLGTGRPAFLDPVATLVFAMFHGFLTKAYDEQIARESAEYSEISSYSGARA